MDQETKFIDEEENPERVQVRRPKQLNKYSFHQLEALDYDTIENQLHIEEESVTSKQQWACIRAQRWLICIIIGVMTGVVAVIIDISIDQLATLKMNTLESSIKDCVQSDCLWKPLLTWIGINAGLVAFAASITTFLSPVAAGSGIPQIKCYLNGVKVPEVVRLKTLFTKVAGIIASVSGGLAVGKEGPMVHSGAVLGAGISQGRSMTTGLNTPFFTHFRNDREKRDFVCAGAAAGVSAAFGAPVGGVLFSLEEAASFWNQALTWRIFLCSILSSYTLNSLQSLYHGHPGDLAYPGLINFGKFSGTYVPTDLFIFFFMGVIGGLCGAAFNSLNIRLMKFRLKYVRWKWLQVIEASVVASVCGTIAFCMMYFNIECKPLGQDPTMKLQFFCSDGEYNTMATLFFTTPESSVKSLFHDPLGSYSAVTLIVFVLPYFFLACWTYGLKLPSGLFIPSLLIGAAWGRLVGVIVNAISPTSWWTQDLAKYSLIGAAAQLGGTVRMTISLTVILIEATGNISYSLPLMAVLLIAKFVGDMFNTGIYDMHIELGKVPVLEWDPPPLSSKTTVSEVMHQPAITLNLHCRVKDIMENLSSSTSNHGGYPVQDDHGKFRGVILRSQLLILIKHKVFVERTSNGSPLSLSVFRDSYPRFFSVNLLNVSAAERELHVDLEPYVNPAPYVVHKNSSFPRIFRLFRALGLRHLVVIDDDYSIIGIVTRKDLYKAHKAREHSRIPCH
ncbi:H(+)/Cl(-) exchange transporter 7-like isoform X2 [Styela clava]